MELEIGKNIDGTYNLWGDAPVKITFFDSDKVVVDDREYQDVEEISVIVRGGFDFTRCEGIDNRGDKVWIDTIDMSECDDIEIV